MFGGGIASMTAVAVIISELSEPSPAGSLSEDGLLIKS